MMLWPLNRLEQLTVTKVLMLLMLPALAVSVASKEHNAMQGIGPATTPSGQQHFAFIGRAYEPQTGELLYSERHDIQLNPQGQYETATVSYRDETGKLFAEKTLRYGETRTLPSTHFYELDSPFYFKVNPVAQGLALEYKDEQEAFADQVAVKQPRFSVVDAGFDRLVSENWQSLMDGQSLRFSFLAVTRSAFYDFRLVPVPQDNSDQLVLRLEPDTAIFRWILDPAFLTYEVPSKKLVRFEGLTNIRKRVNGQVQDENYVAVIEYDYL